MRSNYEILRHNLWTNQTFLSPVHVILENQSFPRILSRGKPFVVFYIELQPGSPKTQEVEGLKFVVVAGNDQFYVSVNKADIIMASLQQTRRKYTTAGENELDHSLLTTVSDLRRLLQQMTSEMTECQHTPPHVMRGTIQDVKSLFGVGLKEKVMLRLPGKCAGSFVLKQFDPNLSGDEVFCRHRTCHEKLHYQKNQSGHRRELYLCPTHVISLKKDISQVIKGGPVADENFSLSMQDHDHKDLIESTSLIGLLEVVYHAKEKSPEILEAILNARNFLIITSTVLEPDIAGPTAVPLVALMLRLILEDKNDTGKVNCLVSDLRKVIEVNLAAFGIVYSWISKSTIGSEMFAKWACLLGFLLGLSALVVGYFEWEVPMVSTYWEETAMGGFSTGVVAAGLVYIWLVDRDCRSRGMDMYYFQGDDDGGLEVSILP